MIDSRDEERKKRAARLREAPMEWWSRWWGEWSDRYSEDGVDAGKHLPGPDEEDEHEQKE